MRAKLSKVFKRVGTVTGAAVATTAGLMVVTAGAALAAPPGDYVNPDGYPCGGSDHHVRNTGGTWYHSWIYKNCGGVTVSRKVVANSGWNGPCFSIVPGGARSLDDSNTPTSASPYAFSANC